MGGSDFQVIPVLDVLGRRAVRAVGGDRSRYQGLRSILHGDADPRKLAHAYREALGLTTLYLADLDAITKGEPDLALYRDVAAGGDVWLDAGLRDADDLAPLLAIQRVQLVAGLESLRGPRALAAMLDRASPERLIVSLDLRDGRPITPSADAWPEEGPLDLGRRILGLGVRRLILLDLARVGRGAGTGTADLLAPLLRERPDVVIAVGGGIAGIDQVRACRDLGACAVLVGSALHDGRIGRQELDRLH